MSIPFVDPWERSSISLLGTALMRPGILPFIPHSLQLGTAHSFRYGHSKVFVYTETMQWAKTAHSPLRRSVCAHAIPHIPGKLYLVSCLTATVVIDVCARLLPLETNPQAENAKKGHMVMICRFSWHRVYNIPWVQTRKLTNANQIYFHPFFYTQTWIRDSGMPHDPPKCLRTTMQSPSFPHQERCHSAPIRFYLGLSSLFALLLLSHQYSIEAQTAQKTH